ncbi:hypothetical protein N0V85_009120 [Neurospora sp. IMI 360204]|nr:hypothetical protein N0V85_009120 [Neurospora sp. IMI 360204]
MSLFHPRSTLSHPSSSFGSQPGFSSLFRMLDDFDKYAQQVGSLVPSNIGTSLLPSSLGTGGAGMETFNPKFDVTEEDSTYALQGELPGVDPKNVEIEFTDPHTLVISGRVERTRTEGDPNLRLGSSAESKKIEGSDKDKSKQQQQQQQQGKEEKKDTSKEEGAESSKQPTGPRYWVSERSYGEFRRVFTFPTNVDQEKVEAKFENGILNIKVPKAEKKGSKKIAIQG